VTDGLGLFCGGRPGQQHSHIIDSTYRNLHIGPSPSFGLPCRPAGGKIHPEMPAWLDATVWHSEHERRPEPRLHAPASVCTIHDGHFGGWCRSGAPQCPEHHCSGSRHVVFSAVRGMSNPRPCNSSSRSHYRPLGLVSLQQLAGKTAADGMT